ncbi:MAG TPA: aminoglycoside phosphotransferase family protein [Candidatus Ruania gallistercoris]|uniref:Aminoglycoside phosphotransferase family protein n=1 Tax=Candidatus Ruania gallistercoris TaxID=2838746 RepID=A0A9D2EF95_9MICO|nr:aminoglycoside phosphotransferase family protein [Candidatus Ruania gallistercoris]
MSDAVSYGTELVRALLAEQHPDLAGLELREVLGGWDNQQWRLGEDLAVRLPRTERGPELLRKEQAWLPVLAERLPLPTPVPVRSGAPSERFEHPWAVVRWVHGEPADRAPITAPGSARALADFLATLHQPAPADAPVNPPRGLPLDQAGPVDGLFDLIAGSPQARALRVVWDEAGAATAWPGVPLWLHGDLHPANVVVQDGQLAGVIDFGDLCAGDPAWDLSAAWLLLPAVAAAAFFDVYGQADEATIIRARGWAILRALVLIQIGENGRLGGAGGKPTWEPAGYAALDRIATAR